MVVSIVIMIFIIIFITNLGGNGLADMYAGKIEDLKPLFGSMFSEYIESYTHWGWIELDNLYGDMRPLLRDLELYDVVTYPDGVC